MQLLIMLLIWLSDPGNIGGAHAASNPGDTGGARAMSNPGEIGG